MGIAFTLACLHATTVSAQGKNNNNEDGTAAAADSFIEQVIMALQDPSADHLFIYLGIGLFLAALAMATLKIISPRAASKVDASSSNQPSSASNDMIRNNRSAQDQASAS